MKNNEVRHYNTPTHLVWEQVGSEVVVLDTTSNTSHHLTGALAQAFTAAATGHAANTQEVVALVQRGFLEPRSPITRRHLVAGGVAGIGLTVASLSLPTVAMASSTQPKPTITAASLVAGEWRWSTPNINGTSTLLITQTENNFGLPTDGTFIDGDTWRLTLDRFAGSPTEANVFADTSDPVTVLTLRFSFPLTGGITAPAAGSILQGTLTKVSDGTVFSEPIPIPQFGTP